MARHYNPADNLPPPKPKSPPGTTKSTRNNGEPWTKENVKELKMLIKQNTPTRVIGLKLTTTHDGSQHWFITAEGTLDDDGWADVWPITPGRWRFELRPYDAPWAFAIGAEVEIDGASEFERRVTVELVRARVTVVDSSGAPVANQRFLIPLDGMSTSLRSDAAGELEFEMPPGTYTLQSNIKPAFGAGKAVPAEPLEVVWTSSGPAEPVLVLRPKE